MRARRPPLHVCPGCGRTFHSWRVDGSCPNADCPSRQDRSAVVALVREQRLARRGGDEAA